MNKLEMQQHFVYVRHGHRTCFPLENAVSPSRADLIKQENLNLLLTDALSKMPVL